MKKLEKYRTSEDILGQEKLKDILLFLLKDNIRDIKKR
jgi:hypothetical protein